MKKLVFAILLFLLASMNLQAQYGQKLIKSGKDYFLAGGICTAVGAALIATPLIVEHYREPAGPDEFREDMLSPILLVAGLSFVMTGVSAALIGIPVTVAGHGVLNSDEYWKDLRYDDPGQRGYGLILEGAGFLTYAQVKAAYGYHFNRNFFLGGGVGAAMDFAAKGGDSENWIDLPVYADFRYSMLNRFYSPYIGLAAGYDILDRSPYLGADLGLRIRLSTAGSKSLLVSATGEVGGSYMRAGVKMGYSF